MNIRNVAIIAHVDHGKTTLVDTMLKQTHTFRDNQKEMQQDLIMDSNDLEKEKGITILAKNTSVFYKDTKINIIDTPGHADFAGEVERTIDMADGALLLVDAAEGVLPQTKFVLQKTLERGLKLILFVNKIDKRDARAMEVVREVESLLLEHATTDEELHMPILYGVGRDGKAYKELPEVYSSSDSADLTVLFETLLTELPDASKEGQDEPFQMFISSLAYDDYVGKLCIGRIARGNLSMGQSVSMVSEKGKEGTYKVQKLYTTNGLNRIEVNEVTTGDIATIAGIDNLTIGKTITDPLHPDALPNVEVGEPTLSITIGPNSSPLSGEGRFGTSRQIKERLLKEKETNIGLRIEENAGSAYSVAGRGELHLAVLIENMRREGYEFEVSQPQVLYKTIDGVVCEPFEEVTVEVETEYTGETSEEMGRRKATMVDMKQMRGNKVRVVYHIASRNLLGLRNILLTKTRGTALIFTMFLNFQKKLNASISNRNGALVATQAGKAMGYGLANAQDRGNLFISPQDPVYEGMVVGFAFKPLDVEVNVCKSKQLTNNRSSGEGVNIQVTTPVKLSLEQYLDSMTEDELLEVTPINLRLRKRLLTLAARRVAKRNG
ncbi:MAG: GTP-binding protein [Candidatus Roizmanbacteria bacterium]|nr:GTP-binding protein [Candidatus Roizmanbacteria bacterium]